MDEIVNNRELSEKIELLIYEGKKIEAIKAVRKFTRLGLKESKDYINNFTLELYEKNPEKFTYDPAKSKGCGTAALLFISLTTAAIYSFF